MAEQVNAQNELNIKDIWERLIILGYYATAEELTAAHETGTIGDCYKVGDDLYTWDGSQWVDIGRIKGDKGDTSYTAEKLGTATVGAATNKPIYLDKGAPKALTGTVGSATQPVWLSAGTLTACTGDRIVEVNSTATGFFKLASGVIIQWGSIGIPTAGTPVTVTLPTAFATNNRYRVVTGCYRTMATCLTYTFTATSFNIQADAVNTVAMWIAIGI